MPNEAAKLFQSDPGNGLSPEPDEEPAGEVAVPVLLIIAFTLFMLVIFVFTHLGDIMSLRMVTGENASERAGALAGSLAGWFILPAIIGWLVSRKAKPPRRMKRFAIVFVALGALMAVGSLAERNLPQRTYRSPADQQAVNQEIVGIVKQAAGTQSANGISTQVLGKDISALTRDFFTQIIGLRRKHDQDAEQYASVLRKLYSADSFSSPARMRQSMQAVDGIQKIDQDFAVAFGKSLDGLKTRVEASSLSAHDKEGFMQGVNNGLNSSEMMATWKDLQKAEGKWSNDTHAFYEFALEQSSTIKVENGHVLIAGEALRQEFNSRLHECVDLRNRMVAANHTMALKQQANLKSFGLTRSDLGLKK